MERAPGWVPTVPTLDTRPPFRSSILPCLSPLPTNALRSTPTVMAESGFLNKVRSQVSDSPEFRALASSLYSGVRDALPRGGGEARVASTPFLTNLGPCIRYATGRE